MLYQRRQFLIVSLVLTILLIFILSPACAPLKEKAEAMEPVSGVIREPVIEQYYIFEPLGTRYVNLRTVGFWEGEGDKLIEFSLDKSPAVLNFAYTPTSTIGSTFNYGLQGSGYAKLDSKYWSSTIGLEKKSGNTYHRHEVVEGTGKFRLKITSSGAYWYVRLGVE